MKTAYTKYLLGQMLIFYKFDFLYETHEYKIKIKSLMDENIIDNDEKIDCIIEKIIDFTS